jgi:hypothetical protein
MEYFETRAKEKLGWKEVVLDGICLKQKLLLIFPNRKVQKALVSDLLESLNNEARFYRYIKGQSKIEVGNSTIHLNVDDPCRIRGLQVHNAIIFDGVSKESKELAHFATLFTVSLRSRGRQAMHSPV